MFRKSFKKIPKQKYSLNTKLGVLDFDWAQSSRRKSIAIYVDDDAKVQVYSPAYISEKDVISFIHQKTDWINKRLEEASAKKDYLDRKVFDDGQKFLFLGKQFPLYVVQKDIKRSKVIFDGCQLKVSIPISPIEKERQSLIKKEMVKWYKQQAREILGGRIFHYERILGVNPKEVAVRTQKRIWGNCDFHKQSIHLNWQIILSPINVIDYIVVHELCHLIVPNHSQRFWKKVEKVLPHYKKEQKWLKENSLDMMLP